MEARGLKWIKAQIILDCVVMAIWGVVIVLGLVFHSGIVQIILGVLCFIAFMISMILNLIKYKKLKKDRQME